MSRRRNWPERFQIKDKANTPSRTKRNQKTGRSSENPGLKVTASEAGKVGRDQLMEPLEPSSKAEASESPRGLTPQNF